MTGTKEFIKIFGNITITEIVEIILAFIFMLFIYNKIKKYFDNKSNEQNERNKVEKIREDNLKIALDFIKEQPKHCEQSINVQKILKREIEEIKNIQLENNNRLNKMEESTKRRERNKIRDTLLQNHRYYTNKDNNPNQSWTKMESEAFWELFKEYENAGGNGYVHTEVLPAMQKLSIIEMKSTN